MVTALGVSCSDCSSVLMVLVGCYKLLSLLGCVDGPGSCPVSGGGCTCRDW